jgi:hypothetical protein
MQEETEPNLQNVFDQALHEQPAFAPEDLPSEWTVGQHRYVRVLDRVGALDAELLHFRELGVRVLDYGRRWGFWIFKTMAPQ